MFFLSFISVRPLLAGLLFYLIFIVSYYVKLGDIWHFQLTYKLTFLKNACMKFCEEAFLEDSIQFEVCTVGNTLLGIYLDNIEDFF